MIVPEGVEVSVDGGGLFASQVIDSPQVPPVRDAPQLLIHASGPGGTLYVRTKPPAGTLEKLIGTARAVGSCTAAAATPAQADRDPMLVAVTDHAAERFHQRVRGTLEAKTEIAARVARAHAAGRVEPGERGALLVRDLQRPSLIYVCRPERDELVVTTLWEQGDDAAVPKRFTDALRRDDHRVTPDTRHEPD